MALSYPEINGARYSWSSVIVSFNGNQFLGCTSVNYEDGVEPATLHGNTQSIIGLTAGQYNVTGDIEFYRAEGQALISAIGDFWMNQAISVQVQYAEDGQPGVTTDTFTVRLVKKTISHSESNEALKMKFTMAFLTPVISNGISPIPSVPSGSFTA